MYITRQSTIANSSKRFAQWTIAFFIICVMYSLYRNRRERQFRLTVFHLLVTLISGWRTSYRCGRREIYFRRLANQTWLSVSWIPKFPLPRGRISFWCGKVCCQWFAHRVGIRRDWLRTRRRWWRARLKRSFYRTRSVSRAIASSGWISSLGRSKYVDFTSVEICLVILGLYNTWTIQYWLYITY